MNSKVYSVRNVGLSSFASWNPNIKAVRSFFFNKLNVHAEVLKSVYFFQLDSFRLTCPVIIINNTFTNKETITSSKTFGTPVQTKFFAPDFLPGWADP